MNRTPISDNLLSKVASTAGISPDEVYEFPDLPDAQAVSESLPIESGEEQLAWRDWQGILDSPIVARLGETEAARRKASAKIGLEVDKESFPNKELLANTIDFCQRVAVNFQDAMLELMEEYQVDNPSFTPEMMRKMQDKGYDLPRLAVYDQNSAQKFFSEMGWKVDLQSDSLFVVFNLPSPVARFWYRGGTESWGYLGKEISEGAIEWGHFYREIMPVIWEEVGYEESEGKLGLERMNSVSEHDSKRYYYIWRAVTPNESDYYL